MTSAEHNHPQPAPTARIRQIVMKTARLSYEAVGGGWNGQKCFGCAFVHEFFENLLHLQCEQITDFLKTQLKALFPHNPAPDCINSPCFAFHSPHHQQPLAELENMLNTILSTPCNPPNSLQNYRNLLEIRAEIDCRCGKCLADKLGTNWKDGREEQKEGFVRVSDGVMGSIREGVIFPEGESSKGDETDQRIGRILDQIKEERREEQARKERKRTTCEQLWNSLDPLMHLDTHKFHQDLFSTKTEGKAERLTRDLLHRNHTNQRAITSYIKHSEYKFKTAHLAKRTTNSACLDITPPPRVTEVTDPATKGQTQTSVNTRYRRLWRKGERDSLGVGSLEESAILEQKMTRSHRVGTHLQAKLASSRRNIAKCLILDASQFFTSQRQPSLHYRSGSTVSKRTTSSPARKLVTSSTKTAPLSLSRSQHNPSYLHSDLRVGF